MKLTNLQLAIICALYLQPDYKFTGDEKRAAERMRKRRLLRKGKSPNTYEVTSFGAKVYAEET